MGPKYNSNNKNFLVHWPRMGLKFLRNKKKEKIKNYPDDSMPPCPPGKIKPVWDYNFLSTDFLVFSALGLYGIKGGHGYVTRGDICVYTFLVILF